MSPPPQDNPAAMPAHYTDARKELQRMTPRRKSMKNQERKSQEERKVKEDALKLVIGNLKSHNHKPKLNQCHQSSLARVENEKILLFPMFRKSTNTKENLIPNQKLLKKANCGQDRTPSVSTKPLQNLKGGKVQEIQKSTEKESQPITRKQSKSRSRQE